MEDQSKLTFKQMLSALLRSNRRHARYIQAFACLAVLVAVAVPLVMRQYGVAMTTTETRLACQYAGNGAHTHNADCYDAYGNLVCPLPEKPFHTHTDSCYATERVLTCALPETAGHAHTDACYDEDGNLTCTIPEEPAHTHSDACYETRTTDQLICGMEETTEEHVHGPACFETVTVELPDPEPEPEPTTTTPAEPEATVPSTPEEDPTPAQEFSDVLKKKDQDGNEYVYLVVQVKAPQGALPKGSTMSLAHVDLNKKDDLTGLTAQEKLDEVLRKEAGEEAAFVQTDAVDITFKDAQGNRVDPAKKVEVRITTANIRAFSDQRTANDEAVANNSLLVLHVVDHQQTKRTDAPNAELIRKAYLVNQDEKDTSTGHEDTILFEATEFSPYIVARVDNAALAPEPEPEPEQPAESEQPAAEATLDLTAEDQPAEAEPERPAQSFTHRFTDTNGQALMRVDVLAPEGAFPLGTTMQVKWVDVSHIEESVTQAVSERTDGKLRDMRAVDITFIDADGHEIEPAKKITVTFASDLIDTQDDAYVVHVDDEGKSEVIDALGSKELEKREMPDQADELVFESDAFSTYVVAVTTLHKELTASDGATYDITVDAPAEAGIPQDAELRVSEIVEGDEGYAEYLAQAQKALDAEPNADRVQLARFFDIKIYSADEEVQPQAPVTVSIQIADAAKYSEVANVGAVHFADEPEASTPEVLDITQDGAITSFDASGFSVYGVVYTVDFHWEVDGVMYTFTLKGADSISLTTLAEILGLADRYEPAAKQTQTPVASAKEEAEENTATEETAADAKEETTETVEPSVLETPQATIVSTNSDEATQTNITISDATKKFMEQVENVEFSNPDLLWVGHLDKESLVFNLIREHDLSVSWPADLSEEQYVALVTKKYSAQEWVLISIKPFNSEESLTITMDNGEEIIIRVTDEQNAPMTTDENGGAIVDTITNPAGTTFDVFDYWVDDSKKDSEKRWCWPGYRGGWDFDGYDFNGQQRNDLWIPSDPPEYNADGSRKYVLNPWRLRGNGNNVGINQNHAFKFSPATDHTVIENINGTNVPTQNNRTSINSYTGDADPTPGLVTNVLDGGYPRLTNNNGLGTNGESLAYLFDDSPHGGKAKYSGADHLLYVDPDGYYTYDSRDYAASFDGSDFTLTEQTSSDTETRGFWPFGTNKYWCGLHMNTQFSMPANGQVLNPKGVYKDMVFEFSGDDDTWLYIDGVLVGDGGGIHNRTKISVNFATGDVVVTGKEDTYGHAGTYEWHSNLRALFEAAGRSTADFADGTNTFKVGTYHTFDMFYLERGGGESNLYIHYNLVSTADFTGHKEYHGEEGNETLLRDQFRFDLIGLDGLYGADGNLVSGKENEHAIMPQRPSSTTTNPEEDGAGTVAKPLYIGNYSITVDNQSRNSQLYRVGVTEDGNVNFGMADIPEAVRNEIYAHKDDTNYTPPIYHYIVREWVPDDAVNAQGKTWAQCTEEERKAGGFSKGDISYDGKIYYMAAQVTYWPVIDPSTGQPKVDGSGNTVYDFGLSKKYYMDEAYTHEFDPDHRFINFDNRHVKPLTLNINKKGESNTALSDAAFKLSFAVQEKNDQGQPINKWSVVSGVDPRTGTTGRDGKLQFANLTAGNYILEETSAPDGYKQATNKWLVQLERFDEETGTGDNLVRKSHLIPKITLLNLDGTVVDGATPVTKDVVDHAFVHEVVNEVKPPANITVEKKWLDENGNDLEEHPTQITFKVYQLQHEHVWGEWIIDKAATEEEEGSRHRICSVDGARQDEVIPKTDHVHTLVEVPAKAATCTESGNIQYWECTKDHFKFSDSEGQNRIDDVIIPALGHNYQVTAEQSATCTESGSKTWTCSRCHDSYVETLNPLGHEWSEWASDGNGHETRTCSRCGETEQRDAQNLFPGTTDLTLVEKDSFWPTWGPSYEGEPDYVYLAVTKSFSATGIFMDGENYYVFPKAFSGNSYNWPSFESQQKIQVSPAVTPISNWYTGSGYQQAKVPRGTLVIDDSGNYYVRTNGDDWSTPPSTSSTPDGDGWYLVPKTASVANATGRRLFAAKAPIGIGKTNQFVNPLAAQALPTSNLTEQALLESLGLTAVDVKDETTGNKLVVYGTQTLPTPVGTDHLWSMDIEIEAEDEDGVAYKYYVIEDNPGAEYATSYAGQENGLVDKGVVTITNQKQPQTTDITVLKADADTISEQTVTYLAGATFYLNKGIERQHPTVISLANNIEVPVDDNGHFTIPTTAGVKIEGLTSGTYTLHEVSAPAGYIITGTGEWEFTVNVTNGEGSISNATNNVASGLTLTIPNPPGAELPEAGGPGTLLHTLCGLALFAAAGYVGLASKRSARKEVA